MDKKYINKAFERINLQQLQNFIMTGGDTEIDERTYEERIRQSTQPVIDRLTNIYADETEREKALCEFTEAVGSYESVFTEIGIKTGARLLLQLLT